jgi:hypothetical protein
VVEPEGEGEADGDGLAAAWAAIIPTTKAAASASGPAIQRLSLIRSGLPTIGRPVSSISFPIRLALEAGGCMRRGYKYEFLSNPYLVLRRISVRGLKMVA